MNADEFRSKTKETLGFHAWPAPEDEVVYRHLVGYRPPFERISGFRAVEIQSCALMPSALHSRKARVVIEPAPDSNLYISFAECRDASEAREVLVDTFVGAMSMEYLTSSDLHMKLGEIGFLGPGLTPTWGSFARGNVAFFVQNGLSGARSILPVLDLLDRDLINLPSALSDKPGPEILDFRIGSDEVDMGERVPFTFHYRDGVHEFLTARLETSAGPIERDAEGRLSLIAGKRGDHMLTLLLQSLDGRVTRSETRIVVR